eukprot:2474321-Amphidinium_carterae.2
MQTSAATQNIRPLALQHECTTVHCSRRIPSNPSCSSHAAAMALDWVMSADRSMRHTSCLERVPRGWTWIPK